MAERSVSTGPDGSVRVTRGGRDRKFTAAKQRDFLGLVAGGVSTAAAARAVGVSAQTVARARREDPGFGARHDDAIEGLGYEIEAVALERALRGRERPIFGRNGEKVGVEYIPSDRLHERLLEANHPRYKREVAAPVVVVAPMSAEELRQIRDLGRDNVEALDSLAEQFADAEREREVKLLEAGR